MAKHRLGKRERIAANRAKAWKAAIVNANLTGPASTDQAFGLRSCISRDTLLLNTHTTGLSLGRRRIRRVP